MEAERKAASRVGGAGRVSAAGVAIALVLVPVGCAEGLSGNGVFEDSSGGTGGEGGASGGGGDGGARESGSSSSTSTSAVTSGATTSSTTGATTTSTSTTSTGGGCSAADFDCGDGNCVALALACNGVADCWGATDEAPANPQCGGVTTGATTGGGACAGQFMCGDGSCIDPSWECDGWPDCFDFSDEASCPCDGFSCGDGECISASWECDDIPDCSDGSDEVDCGGGGGGAWTCDPTYYGDGDCDCGCGELDVDCPTGASVAECDYCGLAGGCGDTCADIDPSANWTCL